MTELGMEKKDVEPQLLYLPASLDFQIYKWASRSFSIRIYLRDPTSQDVLSDKWQTESG